MGAMTARLRMMRAAVLLAALLAAATPALADLQLCNKTSYILDAALGLEDKGATATRGWLRLDPGQCRIALHGAVEADRLYVHARALALYGASPMPQAGHADLCVADGNFVIAGANKCPAQAGQRLVRFTAVKPSDGEGGPAAHLAEEADYTLDQARLAGIQRLLVLGGYDANPIDGVEGRKTEAALAQFLKDRGLSEESVKEPRFFALLAEAAKAADGIGFSWCNETEHVVMAALGVEEKDAVTTRGWYRLDPGKCLKPDIAGRPQRVYSFAEAIDADGLSLRRADKTIVWGGTKPLCTRNVRFEISDQADCLGKGFNATGFAVIELAGRTGATVRFREP